MDEPLRRRRPGRLEPVVLATVGGFVLMAEGVFLFRGHVTLPFGSISTGAAAYGALFGGLAVIALAWTYRNGRDFAPLAGTGILLLASALLVCGGGFWVGSLLGLLSGLLILLLPVD